MTSMEALFAAGGNKPKWLEAQTPVIKGQRDDRRRPSVKDVRDSSKTIIGADIDGMPQDKEEPPTEEEVMRLTKIQSARSYTVDAKTGLAVARREPPIEALDSDGVLHITVKVAPSAF